MNQDQTSASPRPSEMLEYYKFHAELYDRMNQRRRGINILHLSLLAAIPAIVEFSFRYPSNLIQQWWVFAMAGYLGFVLSASWLFQCRAHGKSVVAKFAALKELEERMSFDFFSREEKARQQQVEPSYFAEDILPKFFCAISLFLTSGSVIFGFVQKLSGG